MGGWRTFATYIAKFPNTVDEIDRMLTKNGIWVGRTVGLGILTPEEAVNYGLSGPMAARVGRRVRRAKDFPYYDYETVRLRRPRSERTGMSTIGISCAWRRCGSPSASSSRR
jgi:NADH:ubiquinone oxidoreductase subunit D